MKELKTYESKLKKKIALLPCFSFKLELEVFYVDFWCEYLQQIDALDHFEDLTEIGYHLADLPLEPRLGKVVLYSIVLKCLDPVLTIVCALAYKDPCKFHQYSLLILVDFVVDLQNQMLIKVR